MLSAQYFRENIQIILRLMIIYISLLKSYHGPVTIKSITVQLSKQANNTARVQ